MAWPLYLRWALWWLFDAGWPGGGEDVMVEGQQKCLEALECLTFPNGEFCTPFAPIEAITGYDRRVVRRHVRSLARKGLAEYFRGLCTEDGEFAGAGYCITKAGLAKVGL